MPKRVLIYDPNTLNPYGTELARQLSTRFPSVGLLAPPERLCQLGDTPFSKRAVLAGSRTSGAAKVFRRFSAPVVAVRDAHDAALIVVWTRDLWDALVFAVAATAGWRIVFVYHNPPEVRRRRGAAGWAERVLANRAICALHSPWLARVAERNVKRTAVVTHPPYTAVHYKSDDRRGDESSKPAVAIVGSMRPDKGVHLLQSIARSSGGGWALWVLGGEKLPSSIRTSLKANGVDVHEPFSTPPNDEELQRALVECDVMLAPYRSVTESGSVILAESVGVPVLSFKADALSGSLNERSVADTSEALGQLLREFLTSPWQTFIRETGTRAIETVETWDEVLRSV